MLADTRPLTMVLPRDTESMGDRKMKTTTKLVLVGILSFFILSGIAAWYMIHRFNSVTESASSRPEALAQSAYVAATWGGIGVIILAVCLTWALLLWRKHRKLVRR
jgi:hypothetical protein